MRGQPTLFYLMLLALGLEPAFMSCSPKRKKVELCTSQDPTGSCYKNVLKPRKVPAKDSTSCSDTEIRDGSTCHNGLVFCAMQDEVFKNGSCQPCAAGSRFDQSRLSCIAAASHSNPQNPEQPGDAPKLQLKLNLENGLRLMAKFTDPSQVSNATYEVRAKESILLEGNPIESGESYRFESVSVPVNISFKFKGKTCTLTSRATLLESAALSPSGC